MIDVLIVADSPSAAIAIKGLFPDETVVNPTSCLRGIQAKTLLVMPRVDQNSEWFLEAVLTRLTPGGSFRGWKR